MGITQKRIIPKTVSASLGLVLICTPLGATAFAEQNNNTVITTEQKQQNSPIDLTFTNSSDKNELMYIYMIGTVGEGSQVQGYLDANGNFHAWNTANSPTSIPATDASMVGPKSGESKKLKIPYWFSGRIYYSFGEKMKFRVVKDDLGRTSTVQPTPWNDSDPSRYEDWDFAELTYSQWGLYMNSTQVDMVSNPAIVSGSGDNQNTVGGINPNGFTKLVDSLSKNDVFKNGIQYDKNGEPLRVIAPAHYVNLNEDTKTYMDPYINNVWEKYKNETLTIQPDPKNNPNIKFTGKVVGDKFVFTQNGDTSGYSVTVDKPTTSDVWGCDGALNASNDDFAPNGHKYDRGFIARSLCADFHRGVLGTQNISPATDYNTYYKVNSINEGRIDWYSKYVHENMPNNKAYGFAFDDVGGYESLVHIINPKTASLNVINRGKGVVLPENPTPTDPETPTPTDPEPTDPTTPETNTSQTINVKVPQNYPGYMTFNLGKGTEAGELHVLVDGKLVSKISVGGPTTVRADVPAQQGDRKITILSPNNKKIGKVTVEGLDQGTSNPTDPTPPVTPPVETSNVKTTEATFTNTSAGYGDITFGSGTKPGLVKISVDGGSTSTIAIDGPSTVRANISAPAGKHKITISSNNDLGNVSVKLG